MTADRRPQGDEGFSLIEVITAMVILTIASLAILYGAFSVQRLSGDSRARLVATNVAAEQIERAQALSLVQLDALATQVQTTSVDGRDYEVLTSAVWQPRADGGSPCDSGSGTAFAYKRVSVRVTWPDMGGTQPVRSDTVIAPGVGGFDPNLGNIAVRVRTSTGELAEQVQVSVAGPESATSLTDESGCAFFHQLNLGTTYTVTASAPGRVGPSGATAPSLTGVAVTKSTTTAVQFDYDTAAAVRLLAPAGHPVPASVKVSLGHANLPAPGRRTFAGGPWPLTASGLFPYPGGYRTWLGSCADADPEAVRLVGTTETSLWGTSSASAPLAAAVPGTTTDVQALGARVDVVLTRSGGAVRPNVVISAFHAADTGSGCTGSGETHLLGTTDAQGRLSATLPYGKGWRFRIGSTNVGPAVDLTPAEAYPRTIGLVS